MPSQTISIEVIESSDTSVQCIHALRQIMDYFEKNPTGRGLSAMGKDKQAVYAWFVERYRPGASRGICGKVE